MLICPNCGKPKVLILRGTGNCVDCSLAEAPRQGLRADGWTNSHWRQMLAQGRAVRIEPEVGMILTEPVKIISLEQYLHVVSLLNLCVERAGMTGTAMPLAAEASHLLTVLEKS